VTPKPTKSDIAAVARKLWYDESERREGRHTVRAVLETYFKRVERRRARARPRVCNEY
jgi:hypothetical protein